MLNIIKEPKFIVPAYVALKVAQSAYSFLVIEKIGNLAASLNALDLVTAILLAVFALKDKKIAKWLLAILITLSGLTGLLKGILVVPMAQYILKPLFIILGVYFLAGGIQLITKTKNKENWA